MVIKKNEISILISSELTISLNYLTIGEGKSKTLVLSGLHGNEKTGQIVINKLLEKLSTFLGTLSILPIANPIGFSKNTRQESLSGLDLNRSFLDSDDDGPANKIIQAIIKLTKQYNYVIDLHNFTTDGLIQILSNHINDSDYLASLFNADVVRTSGKNNSLKKMGTLSQYLKDTGIPYVLIELPTHHKVSENQINRIVSGILLHLKDSKHNESLVKRTFDELPKVGIKLVKTEISGIFIKNKNIALTSMVLEGDILGEIVAETSVIVRSPYTGMVCEMDNDERRAVNIRDTLVGIGESI